DAEGIEAARQDLIDKGFTNITESKDAEGNTVLSASKLIDDAEGIEAARQDLIEKGFTNITESKDAEGNTVLSASKLIDDAEGIEAARQDLIDKGFTNITESKDAEGNTVLSASKLIDDAEGIEAAKQALIDKGFTEDQISVTKNAEGKTVLTASKTLTDTKTKENISGNYSVGDKITIDGKEYTITSVDKTKEEVLAGSTISQDKYDQLSDEEKALYTKIGDEITYRYVSIVLYDDYGNPIRVQAEQAVNEGTKVGLEDVGAYNVIALENFVNNQDLTGSVYVGGTLSGGGFIKNGAANGADSYVESFINNSDSTAQIWNVENGSVTQSGKASDYDISDVDKVNTAQYWNAYYNMLLEALRQADYSLNTTDDDGNVTGKLVYLEADGNGVVNIAGKTTSGQYDNDATKLYVVSSDTKYVNVNGIRGVVIAPNADVYLSQTGRDEMWEGQSSGTVVGKNVYNDGSYIQSIYDEWWFFGWHRDYKGIEEGNGSALELHTTKAGFDIEGEEIVKTSAVYSTEGRAAEYTVKAERTDTVADEATVDQKEVKDEATVDQKEVKDGATVDQKEVKDGATVGQKEVKDGATIDQKEVKDGAT
ncbi:MAG: hypothetical protein IJ379_02295, partial [Lachnospiraceae bacterium]|nr:hypothetical protein [Lachnospiraceae bacterium]